MSAPSCHPCLHSVILQVLPGERDWRNGAWRTQKSSGELNNGVKNIHSLVTSKLRRRSMIHQALKFYNKHCKRKGFKLFLNIKIGYEVVDIPLPPKKYLIYELKCSFE